MAGQIAALVNKEQSCKDIILEIMAEADRLLNMNKNRMYL